MIKARIGLLNMRLAREYPGWKLVHTHGEFPELQTQGGLVISMSYAEIFQGTPLHAFAACEREIRSTRDDS